LLLYLPNVELLTFYEFISNLYKLIEVCHTVCGNEI